MLYCNCCFSLDLLVFTDIWFYLTVYSCNFYCTALLQQALERYYNKGDLTLQRQYMFYSSKLFQIRKTFSLLPHTDILIAIKLHLDEKYDF